MGTDSPHHRDADVFFLSIAVSGIVVMMPSENSSFKVGKSRSVSKVGKEHIKLL